MSAFISVLGLLNYDDELIDECFTDAFMSVFDSQALVMMESFRDLLIYECADLETTLPNPAFFKKFVKSWADNQVAEWSVYYKAQTMIKNDIGNYLDGEKSEIYTGTRTDTGTETTTSTNTESINSTSNYNEDNSVYGFNESTAKPKDNSVQTADNQGTTTNDGNVKNNTTGNRDDNYTRLITDNSMFIKNIGEIDRVAGLNTINFIIAEFRGKFCLEVY